MTAYNKFGLKNNTERANILNRRVRETMDIKAAQHKDI